MNFIRLDGKYKITFSWTKNGTETEIITARNNLFFTSRSLYRLYAFLYP